MPHNNTLFIDIHKTAHRQPVTSCIQGTDSVGKSVGQHPGSRGPQGTRWFPACTPPHREDSSPLHNGSHPRCERRDGRSSPPFIVSFDTLTASSRSFASSPSMVTIGTFRRSTLPFFSISSSTYSGESASGTWGDLLHHLFRELLRQPVGPDDGQDIHSRIIDMTQNFLYMAFQFLFFRRVSIQLYHNFVPGYRAIFLPWGIKISMVIRGCPGSRNRNSCFSRRFRSGSRWHASIPLRLSPPSGRLFRSH